MFLYVEPLVVRLLAFIFSLRNIILKAVAFTFVLTGVAVASPATTTYQAKIIKPNGYPLETNNVNFKFTILDPAGSCILYAETYSAVNMANSAGVISFSLGSGVKTYPVSATTFKDVFSNVTPSLSCDVSSPVSSYSPQADDIRKIVMQFNDGSGWQTLPAMAINAVPYAMYANEAQKLNGFSDSDFVKTSTLTTCGASEALRFNGASFSCVAVGNAGAITSSDITTALGYTPATGASFTALSSSLTATDATLSSVSSTVFSVSSTVASLNSAVSSLSTTVAASFAAITSSQWSSVASGISYSAGNVGVGTSSPVQALQVTANSLFGTTSGFPSAFSTFNSANPEGKLVVLNDKSNDSQPFVATSIFTQLSHPVSGNKSGFGIAIGVVPNIASGVVNTGQGTGIWLNALRNHYAGNIDGGFLSNVIGQTIQYGHNNTGVNSPTTTAAIGLRISPSYRSGTITNMYDLLLTPPGTGGSVANRWSIYQEDSSTRNYFAGFTGFGVLNPQARLHLAAGTVTSAPVKFTVGPLLTSPQSGTMEYDGSNFYLTDSNNIRRSIATGSSVGSIDNASNINSNGNIVMNPNSGGGSVVVSATTSSTNSNTGSLVVKGGLGVAGNINTAANLNVSGSSVIDGSLKLSSMTSGSVLFAGANGTVTQDNSNLYWDNTNKRLGIGTGTPVTKFNVISNIGGGLGGVASIQSQSAAEPVLGIQNLSKGSGLQVVGSDNNENSPGQIGIISPNMGFASTRGPALNFATTRSTTNQLSSGVYTPVQAGDQLGHIVFGGDNGVNLRSVAADISVNAGSTWSTSNVETYMTFSTAASGSTAASERVRIASNGNVGIGTTSPNSMLHLYSQSLNNPLVAIETNASPSGNMFGGGVVFKRTAAASGIILAQEPGYGDSLSFALSAVPYTRIVNIQQSGNVGIGTTAPTARLSINNDTGVATNPSASLYINHVLSGGYPGVNGTQYGLRVNAQSVAYGGLFGTHSYARELDQNGSVGGYFQSDYATYGTGKGAHIVLSNANPGAGATHYGLHVQANTVNTSAIGGTYGALIENNSTTGAFSFGLSVKTTSGATSVVPMEISHAGAELMRVTSSGNVGIGTTSPKGPLTVLNNYTGSQISESLNIPGISVLSDNDFVGLMMIDRDNNSGTLNDRDGALYFGDDTTDNLRFVYAGSGLPIAEYMRITGTGNVGIGTTNPGYKLDVSGTINIASGSALAFGGTSVCTAAGCTSSSDERLKENIKPLDFDLKKLLSLSAVQYDWKNKAKYGDQHQIGFIAQNLEKVYPEVVYTDKNTGLKSVTYGHLVAPIIEAIKSIYNRLLELEARIDRQIASIGSLKADKEEISELRNDNLILKVKTKEIDAVKAENAALKAYLCSKDPAASICK